MWSTQSQLDLGCWKDDITKALHCTKAVRIKEIDLLFSAPSIIIVKRKHDEIGGVLL